jgi:hypothetical protein
MAHWSRANGLSLSSQNKQKAGQNIPGGNGAHFGAAKGVRPEGKSFLASCCYVFAKIHSA